MCTVSSICLLLLLLGYDRVFISFRMLIINISCYYFTNNLLIGIVQYHPGIGANLDGFLVCFRQSFRVGPSWLGITPIQFQSILFCQSGDNWGQNLLKTDRQTDRQILWHHIHVDFFFQLNLLPPYLLQSLKLVVTYLISYLIGPLSKYNYWD